MYTKNAVPKHYVIVLLDEAVQRLRDKSSIVVKYAAQLIRVMLTDNLYGALVCEPRTSLNQNSGRGFG